MGRSHTTTTTSENGGSSDTALTPEETSRLLDAVGKLTSAKRQLLFAFAVAMLQVPDAELLTVLRAIQP